MNLSQNISALEQKLRFCKWSLSPVCCFTWRHDSDASEFRPRRNAPPPPTLPAPQRPVTVITPASSSNSEAVTVALSRPDDSGEQIGGFVGIRRHITWNRRHRILDQSESELWSISWCYENVVNHSLLWLLQESPHSASIMSKVVISRWTQSAISQLVLSQNTLKATFSRSVPSKIMRKWWSW